MKKLINDVKAAVPQALHAMVRLNPGLVLMPDFNVVLRADFAGIAMQKQVALISGGGAGHEPAHAGYVGPGMLSAAVVGDVFTSPSTDAVLAAIRAVARPAGVLLIVKNYTGDRLNFGLAAEIARAEGIAVEMVVVADDVALDANGDHAGRRGIAGTVLVHKAAGAAAAAGQSLAAVKDAALRAIRNVGTMGVALTPCTVPAAGQPSFALDDDEIELGLGIHGEAGVRRVRMAPAAQLAGELVGAIVKSMALARGDRIAVLVNNLGGTPTLELQIFAGDVLDALSQHGLEVVRTWCGTFLTALEMAGASVSVLRLDAQSDIDALDAPTRTTAWPAAWQGPVAAQGVCIAPPVASRAVQHAQAAVPDVPIAHSLEAVCVALAAAEPELTRLDQAVGDGDLGISLARGVDAIRLERGSYPWTDTPALLRALSGTVGRALGGTSGPLYAIFLMRAAAAVAQDPESSVQAWGRALAAGCQGIADVGGAREGDRTMLDALWPAARALAGAAHGTPTNDALRQALAHARSGCDATANRVARRGRASYLGERAIGHVDPGALAVCLWLEALLNTPA